MTVTAVTSEEQFKQIDQIHQDKPVIIDFWASWCGPCRAIETVFEKHSQDCTASAIEFYKVNVHDQSKIAEAAEIRAMPFFIVYKNGQKLDELMGAHPTQLAELVDRYK